MALSNYTQNYTFDQCLDLSSKYYNVDIQDKLDSPMPYIGMYTASASAFCSLAMAADAFNGFRTKKLWFPSNHFSLNAFTLTVLAVAMKLPVDLTGRMMGINDKLARVSSLVMMSTVMANSMASLGSMEDNEILLNLAALSILVITISGNICINIFQVRYFHVAKLILGEKIGSIVSMFVLLATLCSSAVMVSSAKRYIESQYNQMHKRISDDEQVEKLTIDKLRVQVRKYWVMAESGAPQFVIARSVTCVTSGVMSLLMGLTLLEAHIRLPLQYENVGRTSSHYKWSINWILVIQSFGVASGTIAPLLRWFTAARLKSTKIGDKRLKDELKVEAYWTQSLKQWRDSPVNLRTRHHRFNKFIHDAKRLLLNIAIGVQVLIVRVSKLVLLISAIFIKGFSFCYSRGPDNSTEFFESRAEMEMDLSCYVLRLEGELELPKRTLRNICNEMDKLIQIGKKKKRSKNLMKLLRKSVNFNGLREFDSFEIQSLHSSNDPPNCWSLTVVTLASIAISLPNITDHKSNQLLSAVSEGLYFTKLIEKTLDSNGELASIRNAADVVWVGVELYRKWQDKDLQNAGLKCGTHKETLEKLSKNAEKTVKDFTTEMNNFLVQDPLNWPVKAIAANSMYRITQTILLEDHHHQMDELLFERLSIMISDIFAACLTNLARVISLKCYNNAIKERDKSIRQAALLLGECEEILENVQRRELPILDPGEAATIEGWRAFMNQDNDNLNSPVSATSPQTYGGHVYIDIELER